MKKSIALILKPTKMNGVTILKAVAVFTTAGGFLADWNKTHLFNPKMDTSRKIS